MKRMNDQVLILQAISEVRGQLKEGMSVTDMIDVMTRLSTLYALLDIKMIMCVVENADTRMDYNRRKVA